MSSAPKLRLTVRVFPRELPSLAGPSLGGTPDNQNQSEPAKPRQFLLIIKDPEKTSLGALANQIKGQWRELWPSEEPLQIKKLLDDAYPDAPFSITCSVADIWVDHGRHAREGFDQHGTVRVIQPSLTSTPSPTHRYRRESSVFQDIEGEAAREAKRKFLDATIAANVSLIEERETTIRTPSRDKEPDPRERQSKRPRLTQETDAPSPSPALSQREKPSGPLFYNDRPAPSFALPRGHRSHPSSNSKSSPEKGLGLGVTASPAKAKTAHTEGPSSMPPPPLPRYSLRKASNSSPLESSSQDESPLENKRSKRLFNSEPRETSRAKGPRTRAASGAGKRSHQVTPSSTVGAASKPKTAQQQTSENERKELRKITALLEGSNTNPEHFGLLQEMRGYLEDVPKFKARLDLDPRERQRLVSIVRKRLYRRRGHLKTLESSGELYMHGDVQTTASENPENEDYNANGGESSVEELPQERPRLRPRKQQNLLADLAATRRTSSLRAHTQGRRDRLSDAHGLAVVVDVLKSARISRSQSLNANDAHPNDGDPEDDEMEDFPTIEDHQDEDHHMLTESDGGDIEFDAHGFVLEKSNMDEPHETMPDIPAIDVPPQRSSGWPTLQMLLRQKKEALDKLSLFGGKRPTDEDPSVSSADESSEDESSGFGIE